MQSLGICIWKLPEESLSQSLSQVFHWPKYEKKNKQTKKLIILIKKTDSGSGAGIEFYEFYFLLKEIIFIINREKIHKK